MYSLVLVDDEQVILQGLRNSIPWEELGFVIAGAFTNGDKALDFIRSSPPDAILSDICMPGRDGLSMVEELRREGLEDIKVVFLSGYDDFQYAQSSMRVGAMDYILKPSDPALVRQIFGKVRSRLDQERSERQQRARSRYLMNESLPILKGRLFTSLLQEGAEDYGLFLEEYCAIFGQNSPPDFTAVSLTVADVAALRAGVDSVGEHMRRMRETCREYFRPHLASTGIMDRYIYLHADTWTLTLLCSHMEQEEIVRLVERYRAELRQSGGPELAVSPPKRCGSFQSLKESYRDSLTELFGLSVSPGEEGLLLDILQRPDLPALIQNRESVPLEKLLDQCFFRIERQGTRGVIRLLAYRIYMCFVGNAAPAEPAAELLAELLERSSYEARGEFVGKVLSFLQVEAAAPDLASGKNAKRAMDIAQYIRDHYAQDITLTSLSLHFYMSPNYISRVFKENMGVGIREYLTRVRLDHADRLIADGKQKLYQVAESVGYPNYEYFRKIYVRYRGKNPSRG